MSGRKRKTWRDTKWPNQNTVKPLLLRVVLLAPKHGPGDVKLLACVDLPQRSPSDSCSTEASNTMRNTKARFLAGRNGAEATKKSNGLVLGLPVAGPRLNLTPEPRVHWVTWSHARAVCAARRVCPYMHAGTHECAPDVHICVECLWRGRVRCVCCGCRGMPVTVEKDSSRNHTVGLVLASYTEGGKPRSEDSDPVACSSQTLDDFLS